MTPTEDVPGMVRSVMDRLGGGPNVAIVLGVGPTIVHYWKTGHSYPRPDHLTQLRALYEAVNGKAAPQDGPSILLRTPATGNDDYG